MKTKKVDRAEIWLGGLKNEAYCIRDVKRIETSLDGMWVRIITEDGCEIETSPHNVVIIYAPEESEDKE